MAVSQDGQTFSWGYGGGSQVTYALRKLFGLGSALGNGVAVNSFSPRPVELLENVKVQQVAAGLDFSLALAEDGKVYGWGNLAVLGWDCTTIPIELESISKLSDKKHSKIKKIAAADTFVVILFENGSLYTVGQNSTGAQGTRANPLIKTDKWLRDLTKVNEQFYQGEKVEDFVISANSMNILTDAGNMYYSGMYLKYRPEPFPVKGNVKRVFATYDSVGYVDQNNKIQFINDQFIDDADKNNGVFVSDEANLDGNVLEVGGSYTLRYALVQK